MVSSNILTWNCTVVFYFHQIFVLLAVKTYHLSVKHVMSFVWYLSHDGYQQHIFAKMIWNGGLFGQHWALLSNVFPTTRECRIVPWKFTSLMVNMIWILLSLAIWIGNKQVLKSGQLFADNCSDVERWSDNNRTNVYFGF